MSTDNELLKKKAFGMIKSIERMSVKEKSQHPTKEFGEDYNRLYDLVLKNNPTYQEILPPRVKFADYDYLGELPIHNYAEIHTFCSQIYELLS